MDSITEIELLALKQILLNQVDLVNLISNSNSVDQQSSINNIRKGSDQAIKEIDRVYYNSRRY